MGGSRSDCWRGRFDAVLEGHEAPIAALAVSPTARRWPRRQRDRIRCGCGHRGRARCARSKATARTSTAWRSARRPYAGRCRYDLTVRIRPLSVRPRDRGHDTEPAQRGCNRRRRRDRRAGGADGKVYFLDRNGTRFRRGCRRATAGDLAAISPDGAWLAAAGIGGSVAVIASQEPRTGAHAGRPGLGVVGRIQRRTAARR